MAELLRLEHVGAHDLDRLVDVVNALAEQVNALGDVVTTLGEQIDMITEYLDLGPTEPPWENIDVKDDLL